MTQPSPRPSNKDTSVGVARPARRIFTRWLPPILGGALALALVFWLYRDLDLGRFLQGLGEAHMGWVLVLAAAILLEQLLNGCMMGGMEGMLGFMGLGMLLVTLVLVGIGSAIGYPVARHR